MFYKLLATILVLGLTAATLLVIRQKRIDLAHDMASTHQRLVDHETQLWRMRAEVISRCRPEDVREALAESGLSWSEIPRRPHTADVSEPSLADGDAPRAVQTNLVEG